MTRRLSVVVVLFLVGVVPRTGPAAEPGPASAPDASKHDPATAEVFYTAAKSATSAELAIQSARKALEADPDHLAANVLLADLLATAKQWPEASEQADRADALLKETPSAPADVKARLAGVRDRLAAAAKLSGRWIAMKKQYADRYAEIGEQAATPGLPSTALAFSRALKLRPVDAQLTGQCERAAAAVPKPPAVKEHSDPAGAKLLHATADGLISTGQYSDALPMIRNAIEMGDDSADAWCDLGHCLIRAKTPDGPLAAVCLLRAKRRLTEMVNEEEAKKLESRINVLMPQADAKWIRVSLADEAFSAAARLLIQDATKAGDGLTAASASAMLAALTGQAANVADTVQTGGIKLGDWVNLMEYVDPKKDWVAYDRSTWREDTVVFSGAGSYSPPPGLAFPVAVDGDYEFRMEFECPAKWTGPLVHIPVGPTSVLLQMGETRSFINGTSTDKKPADKDYPSALNHPKLAADTRYRLSVKVAILGKNARIESELNDRPFVRWQGPLSQLVINDPGFHCLPNRNCPGLRGAFNVVIHKSELRVVRGRFKALRSNQPLVSGPGNLAGRIDLTSKEIEVSTLRLKAAITRNQVTLSGWQGDQSYVALTLGNLTYAEDVRMRWRVDLARGNAQLTCWPVDGLIYAGNFRNGLIVSKRDGQNRWVTYCRDYIRSQGGEVWQAPNDKFAEAFGQGGPWNVCFEKRGKTVTTWVDSHKLLEFEMNDAVVRQVKRLPIQFLAGFGNDKDSGPMKLTLVELLLGKNLPAYQPTAASQPDPKGMFE